VIAARPGIPYQSDSGLGVCDHIEISGNVGSLTETLPFLETCYQGKRRSRFRVRRNRRHPISGNLY
jgi:hypothetical protein